MPFFIIPNYFHTVTKKCRSQFALILDMTFIFVKLSERFIGLFAKKVCVCGKIENAQTSLIRYTFFSIEIYGKIVCVAPAFLHFLIDPVLGRVSARCMLVHN